MKGGSGVTLKTIDEKKTRKKKSLWEERKGYQLWESLL